MTVHISTALVQRNERFDYWADASSRMFAPLEGAPVSDSPFWGRMDTHALGAVQLTDLAATGHSVHRSARHIAAYDPEVFKLSLQLRGSSVISQQDRVAHLRPGDMTLYESSRPYSVRGMAPFEMAIFVFPRNLFRLSLRRMEGRTATRIAGDSGIADVIGPFLRALTARASRGELPARCDELGEGVVDLVSALYARGPDGEPPVGRTERDTQLTAIKAFIEEHLRDDDLSPDLVARAHYVSKRHLYKLFETEDVGVSEYIRHQRLERCRQDLRDPALGHESLSRIAADWGFTRAEHFSRLFRSAYGCSPSEYRSGRDIP
ncbi:AraC-like ligand-binding domain-containing protein [Capillimicrobium parvum]|uniref:Transcriptional activator FeaR n=1 Tax=Capillimicrobium parvum TaxID=2884022 RepID=A0A9E6XUY1_9ACTN|nr:helix-turn-helix domain-containing protein [Capillimicrobium parvum]UGS34568.1 Transcriptional activator FeaR [Capillimicrobium parvum]